MRLDENGEIIEPNLGDAELIGLSFDAASVRLTLRLINGEHFVLRLPNVEWLHFETDCTQNVIDGISVSHTLDAVASRISPDMLQILQRVHAAKPLTIVIVSPIAGADLFAVAQNIEVIEGGNSAD